MDQEDTRRVAVCNRQSWKQLDAVARSTASRPCKELHGAGGRNEIERVVKGEPVRPGVVKYAFSEEWKRCDEL